MNLKNNTDKTCLHGTAPQFPTNPLYAYISKAVYLYNLWTGLYMLERWERFLFNIVGLVFFVVGVCFLARVWEIGVMGVFQEALESVGFGGKYF